MLPTVVSRQKKEFSSAIKLQRFARGQIKEQSDKGGRVGTFVRLFHCLRNLQSKQEHCCFLLTLISFHSFCTSFPLLLMIRLEIKSTPWRVRSSCELVWPWRRALTHFATTYRFSWQEDTTGTERPLLLLHPYSYQTGRQRGLKNGCNQSPVSSCYKWARLTPADSIVPLTDSLLYPY